MRPVCGFARLALAALLSGLEAVAGEPEEPLLPPPEPLVVEIDIPVLAEIKNLDDYLAPRPEMTKEEFEKFLERAESGDPAAMDVVMLCYERTFAVEQDLLKARAWQKRACAKGAPAAMLFEARRLRDQWSTTDHLDLERSDRLLEAVQAWVKPRAEAGHATMQALYALAAMTRDPNTPEADAWLERSAAQKGAFGSLLLFRQLLTGPKRVRDRPRAARLLKEMCDRGSADAMAGMAYVYYKGLGVEKNEAEGAAWMKRAVETGSAYTLAISGIAPAMAGKREEALPILEAAAERGVPFAGWLMTLLYTGKEASEEDKKLGAAWTVKAADMGEPEAALYAFYLYKDGDRVDRDPERAQHYLARAATAGLPLAIACVESKVFQARYVSYTACPPATAAEPPEDEALRARIAGLIEQLGAEEFESRRAAKAALLENGLHARAQLRRALKGSDDPEVAASSAQLLEEIKEEEWTGVLFTNQTDVVDPLDKVLRDEKASVQRLRINFARTGGEKKLMDGHAMVSGKGRFELTGVVDAAKGTLQLFFTNAEAQTEEARRWTSCCKWMPQRNRFEGYCFEMQMGLVLYPRTLREKEWADLEP